MNRSERESAISRIAGSQHGVVTRVQLIDAGVTPDVVAGLVRSGRLKRVHRGVYTAGPMVPDRAIEMAASLACGPGAAISHSSGIRLWALIGEARRGAEVHVTLVSGMRRRPGIRIHRVRTLRAEEVTVLDSIPVTTPARTLLDAAIILGRRELERGLAEALARRLTSMDEIRALVAHHAGRKGARRLASVAGEGEPALTRSEAEERFLALVRRGRLDPPRTNVRIAGHEVDFLWRRERLVVEIDGFAFHSSPGAFESDRRRDAALISAGLRVLRFTWRQVTREAEATLVRLVQALGAPDAFSTNHHPAGSAPGSGRLRSPHPR